LVIGDVSYEVPDQERHGVGEFLRVEDGPSSSLAVVDMSGAYASVTSGARGLLFADDRSTVIVQDEITLTSPEIVRWGVHTEGNIVIGTGGRYAFIQCGTKILYCEIVSEDADLKFSWGPAKSYDPKYTMSKNEMSCDSYRRLMIVTEKPVDTFNVAVIFRVIGSRNEKPALGTAYTWTPMENWSVS